MVRVMTPRPRWSSRFSWALVASVLGAGAAWLLLGCAATPPASQHSADALEGHEATPAYLIAGATRDITGTLMAHQDSEVNAYDRWTLLKGTATTQGYNPSFVTVADVDGDGIPDLVLSQFGPFNGSAKPGQVEILYGTGDISKWKAQVVLPTTDKIYFPNHTVVKDVNGDGRMDIIVAGGFLAQSNSGSITWYEQQASGTWLKHAIVSGRPEFYHSVVIDDFNGDGIPDLLAVGETAKTFFGGKDSATLYLFPGNTTADRFAKTPIKLGDGGGSLPVYRDVDGDGRKDIVCGQFFMAGESFSWYQNPGATGTWTKHVMDATAGPSIQIEWVDNLMGPGQGRFVGSNHTNTADNSSAPESAVYLFTPPADVTAKWTTTKISTGIRSRKSGFLAKQMAPGVLGYGDIDGDGHVDLTVSGDGDSRVFWLKNLGNGQFKTITLAGTANAGSTAEFGQCGGMNVADLDRSGKATIVVTSWEGNTLTLFKRN
jgi:hypothetical protein